MNGAAFSWKTQLSSIIATSTAEAELMSLGVAVQEVLWARQLAQELGFAQTMPTVLYEDNEACIKMAHRELNRSRSKHIHIKYSFIHHHYANSTFDPQPIASQDQVADVAPRCARYPSLAGALALFVVRSEASRAVALCLLRRDRGSYDHQAEPD